MTLLVVACLGCAAVTLMWPGFAPGSAWFARGGRLRAAPPGRVRLGVLVTLGVMLAGTAGGVVAGIVAAVYGILAARTVLHRGADRAGTTRRAELLDLLGSAAADLRAGLPAGTALTGIPVDAADPLLRWVRAAVLLAERTGAPLADVLERVEADARSADRARSASAAQAAGSRATAWLLAGLPAGGIALGYAIGADPLAVLLHTPLGAACALGAMALQIAGVGWAGRLIRRSPAVAP